MWVLPWWYSEDWWDVDKQNLSHVISCSTTDMQTALSGGIALTRVNLAEPDDVIAGDLTMSAWFEDLYGLSSAVSIRLSWYHQKLVPFSTPQMLKGRPRQLVL